MKKKIYRSPEIEYIPLDNVISLILESYEAPPTLPDETSLFNF